MSSLSVPINVAQRMLIQYCYPPILILGAVGSLMNIMLFSRRHLRSNPCCIYFFASSTSALLLVSIGIAPQLYALYNSPNPFTSIPSFCKARSYLNQTSAMCCRWLLVMASLDRFMSCSTNLTIRQFSSVAIARRIILLISGIWFILPIHTLIFSNIQSPGNIACSITDDSTALYHRFYTIIMGGALPALIAGTASYFIWRNFRQRRRQRIIFSNNDVNRRRRKRDQQVLLMLWMQVAILIVSAIPFMSFNVYDTLTRTTTNKSANRRAIEALSKTLMELLIYLITLSFYSNTLVSRTFRKELIVLLKMTSLCDRRHRRRRRICPLNGTDIKNIPVQGTTTKTRSMATPAFAPVNAREAK